MNTHKQSGYKVLLPVSILMVVVCLFLVDGHRKNREAKETLTGTLSSTASLAIEKDELERKVTDSGVVESENVAHDFEGGIAAPMKRPDRDYILIGHPNPSTGPLAGFGAASPWVPDTIMATVNADGGIYIKERGKKLPIKIKTVDTESDPSKALNIAVSLIVQDKIDIMVTAHTAAMVEPVTAVCEKYGIPCATTDDPIEAWLETAPHHWSYHAFWDMTQLARTYIGIWDRYANKTNKVVGGLWQGDPDGRNMELVMKKLCSTRGYKHIDYEEIPFMTSDFSPAIKLFKKEHVEIITGCLILPDFVTFWRQARQMGFTPKIVTMAKACLFAGDMECLGDNLAEGLTMEVWWSPYHPFTCSLTGHTPKQICDAYTQQTGQQAEQTLGMKYAAFEIAIDALKRAQSLNKENIRKALEQTDLDTIVGHIKFNEKHYCKTPLVGGQWTKGNKWPWELKIIYNEQHPDIPKTGEMTFPLPEPNSIQVFREMNPE